MVYDREYDGRELEFETSGGLLNASLVMRDRQTDSWWSIMKGNAIGGTLQGERLKEMPAAGIKTTWADWKRKHPETLVLSVDGSEHDTRNGYLEYYDSDRTFRGVEIQDHRLKPKQPVFSFHLDGVAYAAAHHEFENGNVFDVAGTNDIDAPQLFLFRDRGAPLIASSAGFLVPIGLLEQRKNAWWVRASRDTDWDDAKPIRSETLHELDAIAGVRRLSGFDTFWYNWVLVNQATVVLD